MRGASHAVAVSHPDAAADLILEAAALPMPRRPVHHPPHEKEWNMSVTQTHNRVVLEPASQALVEATGKPPFLYELSPAEARAVFDDVQAGPIDRLPVNDRWITVPADVGDVRVRIVRPPDADGTLPVILYMHGGGWVLGNADTHDRLVRELAVGTGAAVVFVNYDRSPEARYPVAIDQSMYYPVPDAAMDTGSYEQFAEGYFLTTKMMAWFWDAYEPDVERRPEPLASPLRASDEQLARKRSAQGGRPDPPGRVSRHDLHRDPHAGRKRPHRRPQPRHRYTTRALGRAPGDGQPVNFTALQLFRVEDELIVEHWEIFDETTLTQQLSG
jgi:acetyl esterase